MNIIRRVLLVSIIATMLTMFHAVICLCEESDFNTFAQFLPLSGMEAQEIEIDDMPSLKFIDPYIKEVNDFGVVVCGLNETFSGYMQMSTFMFTKDGRAIKDPVMFYNNIASVRDDDNFKYGYLNRDNQWILPPIYDNTQPFCDGFGIAKRNGIEYVFNNKGEVLFSCSEEDFDIDYMGENIFKLYNVREQDTYLLNEKFEEISRMNDEGRPLTKDITIRTGIYYNVVEGEKGDVITGYKVDGNAFVSFDLSKEIQEGTRVDGQGFMLTHGEIIFIINNGGTKQMILINNTGEICAARVLTRTNDGVGYANYYVYDIGYAIDYVYEIGDGIIVETITSNSDTSNSNEYESVVLDKKLTYDSTIPREYTRLLSRDTRTSDSVAFIETTKSEIDGETVLELKNPIYYYTKIDEPENNETYAISPSELPKYTRPSKDVIAVNIDNKQVEFDTEPITENDRTLVPMRAIFEELNATVTWNDETKTATAISDNFMIQFTIDEDKMYKNGKETPLDTPARIVNDSRTMVPLRAISEVFGYKVSWDEDEQLVDILTKHYKYIKRW